MQMALALAKRQLEQLRKEFARAISIETQIIPILTKENSETALEAKNALQATYIEGVYTGIENLLKELLTTIDGGVFAVERAWHAHLLAQAAEANPDKKRPPIISQWVYDRLDRLREFRHVERNVYRHLFFESGVEENWARLKEVFPLFEAEIEAFMQTFDSKPSPQQ